MGALVPEESELFEKMVLGEIEGKNSAIHTYDDIIWKIRTGYLTLVFAGWAILLKSIADSQQRTGQGFESITIAMFFFSVGLAAGGWFVDRAYSRRKARVIHALDRLMQAIADNSGDFGKVPVELLKVAGDNPDVPYDSRGYREGLAGGLCVYFVPLITLAVAGVCIFIVFGPPGP
jgi:hypothetical protein